jgi:hypothetical protein
MEFTQAITGFMIKAAKTNSLSGDNYGIACVCFYFVAVLNSKHVNTINNWLAWCS